MSQKLVRIYCDRHSDPCERNWRRLSGQVVRRNLFENTFAALIGMLEIFRWYRRDVTVAWFRRKLMKSELGPGRASLIAELGGGLRTTTPAIFIFRVIEPITEPPYCEPSPARGALIAPSKLYRSLLRVEEQQPSARLINLSQYLVPVVCRNILLRP